MVSATPEALEELEPASLARWLPQPARPMTPRALTAPIASTKRLLEISALKDMPITFFFSILFNTIAQHIMHHDKVKRDKNNYWLHCHI